MAPRYKITPSSRTYPLIYFHGSAKYIALYSQQDATLGRGSAVESAYLLAKSLYVEEIAGYYNVNIECSMILVAINLKLSLIFPEKSLFPVRIMIHL